MNARAVLALVLLAGCSYTLLPPPAAPADPRERQRAEASACSEGRFPRWLDDDAMKASLDLDRREASASSANESFHGATYSAQPPPTARPSSRTTALLDERAAFQRRCDASKRQVR